LLDTITQTGFLIDLLFFGLSFQIQQLP